MTKSKGLQFRKTEADTLVVEAQKHPGEQFKVTKLSKTSAVYLLKKLRGRGCSPELTFTKVWYLDDGPKTEKNRRYHVFYGISGQTPRERWGTCCPSDPECPHSYLDSAELASWMDTPISDAEAEQTVAGIPTPTFSDPPPWLSRTEPEPAPPEPEPDVVIGQTYQQAFSYCQERGWSTAKLLEAGPAAEAEVARMIKPKVVRL